MSSGLLGRSCNIQWIHSLGGHREELGREQDVDPGSQPVSGVNAHTEIFPITVSVWAHAPTHSALSCVGTSQDEEHTVVSAELCPEHRIIGISDEWWLGAQLQRILNISFLPGCL